MSNQIMQYKNQNWYLPEAGAIRFKGNRVVSELRCVQKSGNAPGNNPGVTEFVDMEIDSSLAMFVRKEVAAHVAQGYLPDSLCAVGNVVFSPSFSYDIQQNFELKLRIRTEEDVMPMGMVDRKLVTETVLKVMYMEREIVRVAPNGTVYLQTKSELKVVATATEFIECAMHALDTQTDFKLGKVFVWKARPKDCKMAFECLEQIEAFVQPAATWQNML